MPLCAVCEAEEEAWAWLQLQLEPSSAGPAAGAAPDASSGVLLRDSVARVVFGTRSDRSAGTHDEAASRRIRGLCAGLRAHGAPVNCTGPSEADAARLRGIKAAYDPMTVCTC
jgi:hypothetical protein